MAGEQTIVDGKIVDDDGVVDDIIDDEEIIDDDEEEIIDDDDDDGEKKAVEPWMADESKQPLSDVPASTHIRMKQKLKGRLTERNEENERLRRENEALKAGMTTPSLPGRVPKRPVENEFDTVLEYEEALGEYEQKMVDVRLETSNRKRDIQLAQANARAKLEGSVDEHYSRAAKLIQDNGIDTEVYKAADLIVREAIETMIPGKGDITTDQIISILGDGSEKVMYYLGRNKNALNEFKSLFAEDPTGLKATLFLGQQRERLLNSKRRTSKAPPPSSDAKGDKTPTSAKASSLLKRRKAAQAKGNLQLAYDLKKQAKAQGVDVSEW